MKYIVSLFLMLFSVVQLIAQTNAPSIRTGVTFQWSEATQSPSSNPATIESIMINSRVFNLFVVPTSYELTRLGPNGHSANRILQNGTTAISGSSNPATWSPKALSAFQDKNLNHYFESNSNGSNICNNFTAAANSSTSTQRQTLFYSPSIPSNDGGVVAITERNANNCYHIEVFGIPRGGGVETSLGQTFVNDDTTRWGFGGSGTPSTVGTVGAVNPPTAGSDYWLSDRVVENGGTIGIALFYLNDVAPIGSLITKVQITAATADHGDGKFFIIQKYAHDNTRATIMNKALMSSVAVNNNAPVGSNYSVQTAPSNGTISMNSDGTYAYTPNANFIGTDSFVYKICLPAPNQTTCDEATVTIKVDAKPSISNNSPICTGSSAVFTITGTAGNIVTYTGAVSGTATLDGTGKAVVTVPNATSNVTLNVTKVKNVEADNETELTGISSTVTVNPASVGGTATAAASPICSGGSTTITLTGYTGSIQWQTNASGSFVNISSATSATYTTPPLISTTKYRAIVTSGVCSSSTSTEATVTVNSANVGGTVAGGTTICSGSSSGLLNLSGNTGSVVKWQSSISPFSEWTDISNTASTYTSGSLTQTTQFRAVVQSGVCSAANSAATTVTVNPTSVGGTATAAASPICSGGSTTITLTGYTGSIQWQTNASGSFANIPSATSATYTTPSLSSTTRYRAIVTSGVCSSSTSTEATVTVDPASVGGTVTAAASPICSSGSTTITLTGYTGSIQWQTNASGSFANIPSATSATYTTPPLTSTTRYRATVTSGVCSSSTSTETTVTVNPTSVGGTATAAASPICSGVSTTITVTGYTGSIQWQTNASGSFVNIPSATSATYTTPSLSSTTRYRAIVTSGVCSSSTSTEATVTVNPTSVGGTATAAASPICSGGSTTITLTGYTGSIQWQTNASGSFVNIPSETSATYTTPSLSSTTRYRAIVTSGVCSSSTSTEATVTVIAFANLALVKTVNNAIPSINDEIIFTLKLINKGPCEATGVRVKDLLPIGLTFISTDEIHTGTTYNSTTGIWDLSGVTVGMGSYFLKTKVKVGDNCGSITNKAEIWTSNNPDPDSTPQNGT